MLAPVIEELAAEFSGHVRVVKLNTDESPNTSARFRIQGIPTLILFVNGKEKDRMVGVLPKRAIADRIQSLLT
jgi:Thioredoxin domain-containing protein